MGSPETQDRSQSKRLKSKNLKEFAYYIGPALGPRELPLHLQSVKLKSVKLKSVKLKSVKLKSVKLKPVKLKPVKLKS